MSPVIIPEKQPISVDQAAIALGIGRGSAYRAVHDGTLPTVRIGRRLLVPRQALERMLAGGVADEAQREQEPTEAVTR